MMNDKEWKIFNINKSIDNLYEKSGYFDKYGIQFLITIVIIILFVLIFTYISILNNLAPIRKNWSLEKCNPLYMPFAGFINNDSGTKSNLDYTIENFNSCLGVISEDVAIIALDPINYLINLVTNSFSSMTSLFGNLAGYFSAVIATITLYVREAYQALLNGTISFMRVAEVIKDTFGKVTGIITAAMYSQILMMNLTFLWVVYTPQKSATFMLLGSIISLLVSVIVVDLIAAILWFLSLFAPPLAALATATLASETLTITINLIIITLCTIWLIIITLFTNSVLGHVRAHKVPLTL